MLGDAPRAGAELMPDEQTKELAKTEEAQLPANMDFDMTRPKTLLQAFTVAQYLANSGMFPDAQSARQAFGKIAIALDLGLSPTQGLRSIHIIEGKPELGFDVIGALLKAAGYSWRTEFEGREACNITFYSPDGAELGVSDFTMDDAKAAGLAGKKNWTAYARNMLFARALSNGARWFAPEVFGGAVYGEGEISGKDLKEGLPTLTIEPEDMDDFGDDQSVIIDSGATGGGGIVHSTVPDNWLGHLIGGDDYQEWDEAASGRIEEFVESHTCPVTDTDESAKNLTELKFKKWLKTLGSGENE